MSALRLWGEVTSGAVGMVQRLEFADLADAETVRDRYRATYPDMRWAVGAAPPATDSDEWAVTYANAKAAGEALQARVDAAGAALGALSGGGPMGLTPDDVKASPAWRTAKAAFDQAFARLRRFNAGFVKTYRAEIKAERRARFA